jgi:hypothetical protein
MEIGQYNVLKVARFVDFGAYLSDQEGEEVLLPKKYHPEGIEVGQLLRVFVYTDSEDRPVATTLEPKALVGDLKPMKVKDTTPIGAFLDWGLEKDLFLPKSEMHRPVQAGDYVVVKVLTDPRTGRVVATSKLAPFLSKEAGDLYEGQEVMLLAYEKTDLGIMCIIRDSMRGMLYRNEVFRPIETGDSFTGYIKEIREDGKIDLSLYRNTKQQLDENETHFLDILESEGGFLPMGDFSTPEEIKQKFQMSKKVFKQLIGRLYKERVIVLESNGIRKR